MSDPLAGPVVVTGMHGSLVGPTGALLSELGCPLLAAGTGPDEPSEILALQRQILAAASGSPEGWSCASGPSLANSLALAGLAQSDTVLAGGLPAGLRGWADPRSSLLLDWLDDQLDHAGFVLVYRPPWDVATALEPTGVAPQVILATWTAWNEFLLDFLDRHDDRCVLIDGAALVSDPVSVTEAIEHALGLRLDAAGLAGERRAAIWTAAARVTDRRQVLRRADREPVHKLLEALPVEARLLLGELDRRAAALDTTAPPELLDLVPQRPGSATAAAVVVSCRDAGPTVVDALASVRSCQPGGLETVVVDRASSDDLSLQVLDQVEAAGVTVVRCKAPGLAAARNIGLAATIAPMVVFLDDAQLLRPGFVAEAQARLAGQPRVAMVRSRAAHWHSDGQGGRHRDRASSTAHLAEHEAAGGAALRRSALEEVGGYDASLMAPGFEHWDVELSLRRRGWETSRLAMVGFDHRAAPAPRSGHGTLGQIQGPPELPPVSTPMGRVVAKHAAALAESPAMSSELLGAAASLLSRANQERDQAVAALADSRAELAQLSRRSRADLAARDQRLQAGESDRAAMGRQVRVLEERLAELTEEVARRERGAEAGRARAAQEHALRLVDRELADQARAQAERLAAEIVAIHGLKVWRWSAGGRSAYRLLRRLRREPGSGVG